MQNIVRAVKFNGIITGFGKSKMNTSLFDLWKDSCRNRSYYHAFEFNVRRYGKFKALFVCKKRKIGRNFRLFKQPLFSRPRAIKRHCRNTRFYCIGFFPVYHYLIMIWMHAKKADSETKNYKIVTHNLRRKISY